MARALVRGDGFADLGELRGEIDRIFGDLFDIRGRGRLPEIDVLRENNHMTVRADMPGIKPEEVEIAIQDGVMTVSSLHDESTEAQDKDYVRRERRHTAFRRSLVLPSGVKADEVTATTHDGVVEITIPLTGEADKQLITITPTAA